ncbi:hypothetical protein OOU_Y34scaffold00669g52 [Pyricularia oryzae Y34]|uniref:Uncharacterized protein n=2 Tax=Pyricularia oryzae TaxID=318829 RepID=A0AA97PIP3_PYRO3|nr:hypothetical protein OOU_Y34scaffold00669g52 [Pyricularia oryzae Y34]
MVISASVAKKGRADRESIDLDCRRCQYSLGVPLQGCHPELYQEQTGYHVVFALIAWEVPDFAELDS